MLPYPSRPVLDTSLEPTKKRSTVEQLGFQHRYRSCITRALRIDCSGYWAAARGGSCEEDSDSWCRDCRCGVMRRAGRAVAAGTGSAGRASVEFAIGTSSRCAEPAAPARQSGAEWGLGRDDQRPPLGRRWAAGRDLSVNARNCATVSHHRLASGTSIKAALQPVKLFESIGKGGCDVGSQFAVQPLCLNQPGTSGRIPEGASAVACGLGVALCGGVTE